jgi:hypothetical protein
MVPGNSVPPSPVDSEDPLTSLALELGFSSPGFFREHMGISLSKFRGAAIGVERYPSHRVAIGLVDAWRRCCEGVRPNRALNAPAKCAELANPQRAATSPTDSPRHAGSVSNR